MDQYLYFVTSLLMLMVALPPMTFSPIHMIGTQTPFRVKHPSFVKTPPTHLPAVTSLNSYKILVLLWHSQDISHGAQGFHTLERNQVGEDSTGLRSYMPDYMRHNMPLVARFGTE